MGWNINDKCGSVSDLLFVRICSIQITHVFCKGIPVGLARRPTHPTRRSTTRLTPRRSPGALTRAPAQYPALSP